MILLLQEPHQIPFLGPWGQLVLLILFGLFGYFAWRQRQWRSTAEAASAALAIAQTELQTWKERGERLGAENRELLKDLALLKARTDLQPVVDALNSWTVESRGYFLKTMERLEDMHSEHAKNITKVVDHLTSLTDQVVALTVQFSHSREK